MLVLRVRKDVMTTVIEEYDNQCGIYSSFTEKMEKLVRDLIKENDLRVHSINSRLKTRASLQAKLTRLERKFSKLDSVTDISGVRIITYFADDVDKISEVIEREFDVDEKRSVDRRELLDPDRFGYLSLHYVVRLSTARLKLTEYHRFAKCHAEIQIRSILQHAWAEIEHDLGYKGKYAVPREIRRRFSRLAGLLEIADTEFAQIRGSLQKYEQDVPKQIIKTPTLVLVDKASLLSFIRTNPTVHELDKKIASITESRIVEDEEFVNILLKELRYADLRTIAELDSSLVKLGKIVEKFAKSYLIHSKYKQLSAGICLGYLIYVLIASKKSIRKAHDYLDAMNIGDPEERNVIAKKVISLYSEAASNSI